MIAFIGMIILSAAYIHHYECYKEDYSYIARQQAHIRRYKEYILSALEKEYTKKYEDDYSSNDLRNKYKIDGKKMNQKLSSRITERLSVKQNTDQRYVEAMMKHLKHLEMRKTQCINLMDEFAKAQDNSLGIDADLLKTKLECEKYSEEYLIDMQLNFVIHKIRFFSDIEKPNHDTIKAQKDADTLIYLYGEYNCFLHECKRAYNIDIKQIPTLRPPFHE